MPVGVETLRVSKTRKVWVSLGISLGVGVNVANEAVSKASAVWTPLGVAVAGGGVGLGAEQAAARASVRQAMKWPARIGQGTRAL